MPFPKAEGLRIGEVTKFEFSPSLAIIAAGLNKFGMDIRSFREPLERAVREVMIPSFQKNFEVGGRPGWVPLSQGTFDAREKFGTSGSNTPLDATGNLKRNMGYMSIWTFTRDFAAITDLPERIWYGKVHQAGTRRGSVVIPARPFVVMQPEDEIRIQESFDVWIGERAERAGWKNSG